MESPILTKSGEERHVLWQSSDLVEHDGIVGTISFGIDLTRSRQAEEARSRLADELARKNQELHNFLYAASHDLRAPLVNIQGFGMMLEEAGNELAAQMTLPDMPVALRERVMPMITGDIPKALGFIRAGLAKMDLLISGMVRLFRLGQVDLQPETIDMDHLVRQIVAALGFQVQLAGADIEIETLPACQGDLVLVNQVFSNLFDNALKYRDAARPLHIRISGRVQDDDSVYCVADTGLGIASEEQVRIWELFQRLDPAGAVAGEGLGLNLVKRIVERHGGRVWVESEPGQGSRFFVALRKAMNEPTCRDGISES